MQTQPEFRVRSKTNLSVSIFLDERDTDLSVIDVHIFRIIHFTISTKHTPSNAIQVLHDKWCHGLVFKLFTITVFTKPYIIMVEKVLLDPIFILK